MSKTSHRKARELAASEQKMRDILASIDAYVRGMLRYRWRALAVAWIVSVMGWVSVHLLPDVYEADARIYVDTENAIRPLLEGIASSSNVLVEVSVVVRELLSRPNLEEVARLIGADIENMSRREVDQIIESLRDRLLVAEEAGNIYVISFSDPDRERAVAVVDALVNTFIERSLGADRSESDEARRFLEDEISEYESRLTIAENRLADFKRENVALMPGQQGDYFSRLQEARNRLSTTNSMLALATERRRELLRQLEGEEPVFGIMSQESGAETSTGYTSTKIRELELQLDELRLQYTDKHPRIGQILDTIKLLKEQQMAEAQANVELNSEDFGASQINPLDLNPVYQNMRIQLTNVDVEIASLRQERNLQSKEVEELQLLVDTVPQVEARLNSLNRDYGVVKTKYEQLLRQFETASIGESVESTIDAFQFQIIEPPFVSQIPTGPNRMLFLAGVMLVAFGIGGALALLFNEIHPVFYSGRSITKVTGMPVLGYVSALGSPANTIRQRVGRIWFTSLVGALVIAYAIIAIFSDQISPALRAATEVILS